MNKFINKLLLSLLSVSLVIGSSYAMHQSPPHEDIALRYINFLSNVSPSSGHDAFSEMPSLFALNCHKIVNGKLSSKNIAKLETQLRSAQADFKEWTIEPNSRNCIFFPEDNTYVLQFELGNLSRRNLIVIVYIKFDENGLITNINEVFNTKAENAFSTSTEPQESKPSSQSNTDDLKQAGLRYIEFLQSFGDKHCEEMHPAFFDISSTCLKLINGGIVSKGRDSLEPTELTLIEQLHNAKKTFGSWDITLDKEGVIANLHENVCMVRYEIEPEKSEATYTVIAYLRFDEEGKIQEINEVYNQKDS